MISRMAKSNVIEDLTTIFPWVHKEPEIEYERVQGTIRDALTDEEMAGLHQDNQFLMRII